MDLTLHGRLINLFKNNDFTDSKTGEVQKGKYYAQFMEERVQKDGSIKNILSNISLPDSVASNLKDLVGKDVKIKVGVYVQNGKHGFYGIE